MTILFLTVFLPVAVFFANTETNLFSRAYLNLTGKKADLTVNLTTSLPFEPLWSSLAQGGEEKGGMLESIIPQVKNLRPRYIRIDHIYDYYDVVYRNTEGNLDFNWINLDKEIKDILATGAKPFLSLSYMPAAISTGNEVDIPAKWSDWELVIQKTIEHVSGVNELSIADVYYEVWNEPDLFGDYKVGKGKDYLKLYHYASYGAQKAQNVHDFKFGGPATTGLYKAWFDGLLGYVGRNYLRLDFYSWHKYSKNLKDFEIDLISISSWLEAYPKYSGIEFIISETGFNSENDPGYDTEFSAIQTLGLYALVSSYQEKLKIFTFEIKDGPGDKQKWGRWGLLTHEKFGEPIAKPRYKAIEFLNLMEGEGVPVYGHGTWVKAFSVKSDKTMKLLIVNYDPFDKHYENVPILFVGLPSSRFTLRRRDFLNETIEYPVESASDNWKTEILMEPNSASIVEIIPSQ